MAAAGVSPMAGVDRRSGIGRPSRNGGGNPFTWAAPSPSPGEVEALERQFPEVIQLPTEAIEREAALWSSSGLIIRTLSRWVPSDAVIREFRRAGLGGRIDVIPLAHRSSLLRFELPEARGAALRQPWVVNGQPLAMEEWRPNFIPAADAVRTALLWIRLPNLPLELWSEDTLRTILSVAGDFVAADAYTKERRRGNFARACVRVDLSKPLRPGVRVQAPHALFWQQFAFENVDCICPRCASIHLEGPCSASSDPEVSVEAPRFGPWMAALRRRKVVPDETVPAKVNSAPPSGKSGHSAETEVSKGGWIIPGKTSRRKALPPPSALNVAIVNESLPSVASQAKEVPCRFETSVPALADAGMVFGSAAGGHTGSVPISGSLAIAQRKAKGGKRSTASALPSLPPVKMNQRNAGGSKSSSFVTGESSGTKDCTTRGKSGPLLLTYVSGDLTPLSLSGSARPADCTQASGDPNPVSLKRARAGEAFEPVAAAMISSDMAMTIDSRESSRGLRDSGSPSLFWNKIDSGDMALPVDQPAQGDGLSPDRGSPSQCLVLDQKSDLHMEGE